MRKMMKKEQSKGMKRLAVATLLMVCAVGLNGLSADAAAKKYLEFNEKVTEKSVTFTWKKTAGVDYYKVFKRTHDKGKFKEIAKVKKGKKKYIDKKVKKNKKYDYKIVGYKNKNGKSKAVYEGTEFINVSYLPTEFWTEELCCSQENTPSYIQMIISGDEDEGVGIKPSGYDFQRRIEGTEKWETIKVDKEGKDTTVEAGKAYEYRVRTYWKRKGKKTVYRYSTDIQTRYAVNDIGKANLKVELLTPENVDTDTLTFKLINDVDNGAILFKDEYEWGFNSGVALSSVLKSGNYHEDCIGFNNLEYSFDGKTWAKFYTEGTGNVILQPGKEMTIRMTTKEGEKFRLLDPNQYEKLCLEIYSQYCDYENHIRVDLLEKSAWFGCEGGEH